MSKKYTEIEKIILREISFHVYESVDQDSVKADHDIRNFGITDIDFLSKESVAHITLKRPGFFIGAKGVLIDGITERLKKKLELTRFKFYIIENNINNYFIDFVGLDRFNDGDEEECDDA